MVGDGEVFLRLYGGSLQDVRCFFAPGRVNLIGEHLDYNGGRVLPAALDLGVWLWVRPRRDGVFRFASTAYSAVVEVRDPTMRFDPGDGFANYPKGVLRLLREAGAELSGLECLIDSNLPSGAGLSSSAAVEVVTAFAGATLSNYGITRSDIARLAQKAENEYIGVQCGIMDQFVVSVGRENTAVWLDCQTLSFEYVPIDLGGYVLMILNSNKERRLSESLYNQRRQECQMALSVLKVHDPDLQYLADLTPNEWIMRRHLVADAVMRQRVDHVVGENERVALAAKAMKQGDIGELGRLLDASHASLKTDYQVTGAELDTLVEAARGVPGCVGARMTGAGFGGSAISIVEQSQVPEFVEEVSRRYEQRIGYRPTFYQSRVGGGVREMTQCVANR